MPRPKRARVPPSAPVNIASRRVAAAENAKSSTLTTRSSARKPLANLSNVISSVQANSDSSDSLSGVVKNAPKGSRRQGGGVRNESAMMAGGLGEGEIPLRRTKGKKDALGNTRLEKQRANEGLAVQTTDRATRAGKRVECQGKHRGAVKDTRNRKDGPKSGGDQSVPDEEGEMDVDAPEAMESGPLPELHTTLENEPVTENPRRFISSPKTLEHIAQQIPSSVPRARHTPGGERSILALGNWKRRPRQPSIVRTGAQQPSDLDIEDSFELPISDDFNPDDESTPLKVRGAEKIGTSVDNSLKGTRGLTEAAISSSRKRKRSPLPGQSSQLDQQHVTSSIPKRHRESSQSLPSDPVEAIGRRSIVAPEHSVQPDGGHDRTPKSVSDTQASPLSSSPLDQSPFIQPRQPKQPELQTKKRTTTRNATQTKQDKRSKRLTTAELTSFLPRRRNQQRKAAHTPFEILSSPEQETDDQDDLEEDEDELAPRRHKATKSRAAKPTKQNLQPPTSAKKKNKSKRTASSVQASRTSEPKRRYGRKSSDKENQDEDEEPSEFMRDIANGNELNEEDDTVMTGDGRDGKRGRGRKEDHRKSLELSAAAKKFAEVDEWEMEFESVETEGRSSSPWR